MLIYGDSARQRKDKVKMKTKEELIALKEEIEKPGKNLAELSEDELAQVSGGVERHDIDSFIEPSIRKPLEYVAEQH